MTNEEWRKAPCNEKYEVSNLGRVRSLYGRAPRLRETPRILREVTYSKDGRKKVALGNKLQISVHALVLWAFVGPRPPGMECRHLDGDPSNNALVNLAWGTPKENAADQRRHGTNAIHERHGMAKLTSTEVAEIRDLTGGEIDLIPQKLWAEIYGISQASFSRVRTGALWKARA